MRTAGLVLAAMVAAGAAPAAAEETHERVTMETRLSRLGEAKLDKVSNYLVDCANFGGGYGDRTASESTCNSLRTELPAGVLGVVDQALQAEGRKDRRAARNWFFSTEYSMYSGRDNSRPDRRPEHEPLLVSSGGDHSSTSSGKRGRAPSFGSSGSLSGLGGGGGGGGGTKLSTGTSSGSGRDGRKSIAFRETQGKLVPDEHGAADAHDSSSKASSFLEVLRKADTGTGEEEVNPFNSHAAAKWPAKTIPYCWGNPNDWTLASAIYMILGMRLISSHTHLSFYHAQCTARGHKVRLTFAAGQANSWVGVVHETGAGSAVYFPSALGWNSLPGWSAYLTRKAATHQSINYDSTRGLATTAAHEWMHTLGFEHTHQRTDADTYVTVSDRASDTANCALSANGHGATTYHLESIMHYPADIGGHPHQCGTIAVKTPTPANIGSAAKMGNPDNNWCPCDTTYINARYP